MNARLLRLLVGLALIAAATWYIYLYAFNKVSIAGVVNAPLVAIAAQVDGHIAGQSARQGAMLEAGQPVAVVVNGRIDNRTVMELKGQLDAARGRLAALRDNIAELSSLKAVLERRSEAYRAAWIDYLAKRVAEEEAVFASVSIVERQTQDALRRGSALVARGAVSVAAHDDLAYAHQRAIADLKRAEAGLAKQRAELAVARTGILLSNGNWSDVPYSDQRIDEIEMRLAGLRNEESVQRATLAEIESRYAAEQSRIDSLSREVVAAPVAGVVWRSKIAPGSAVVRGAPLAEVIDCTRLYVEATTRERFFETLLPGRRVRVRLEGSNKDLSGTIREIVGPAAALASASSVAVLSHRSGREAQVIVDIAIQPLPAIAGSTCNVGRTATVYFD